MNQVTLRYLDILFAALSGFAAIAAAYAAINLNNLEKNQRKFDEKMTALSSLSEWSKNHTISKYQGVSQLDL